MRFLKYQALGNDYIILESKHIDKLPAELIRRVCDRHYGIGGDGVLILSSLEHDRVCIQIFNPDGSEAEKSGNGLRIFARYLWDEGYVGKKSFNVSTKSGVVTCSLLGGSEVAVKMGTANFSAKAIPLLIDKDEAINEEIIIGEDTICYTAVSMGNPHCVVISKDISATKAKRYGELLENHKIFPERTNVQFVNVVDRNNVRAEIWERGAGYTLSSGSSSSAIAAAVKRLGLCDNEISVHMPGGSIHVTVSDSFEIEIRGEVRKVADGIFSDDFIASYIRTE